MKCPHCLDSIFESWTPHDLEEDKEGRWRLEQAICPSCKKSILRLRSMKKNESLWIIGKPLLVYPRTTSRTPLDPSIPEKFAKDYRKAALILVDSPEASAALSRRCLQNLLREKAGIKKGDLSKEIQQVLNSKQLPSYLANDLDAVRNIGNFATHPNKSKTTGEIVEVEPKEAEWTLNVLEGLFDFYFVQPEKAKQKREALNHKLKDAGKPPMK